jgi:very-short-patch-repair endonuclease
MHTHSPDEAVAALAERQHGVIALAQLRALGLTESALRRRCDRGRLHRLHRGVYAVGHTALSERAREIAAVLASGQGAALSHRSAARLWRIVSYAPGIEVTCGRSRPPGPGILVHRSTLSRADRASREGIAVTGLGRTLVDLAEVLSESRLADAVNEAEVQRLFDLAELEAALARTRARRGRHKLRRVLADWRPRPLTRSEAERRFLELCVGHGLPRPRANASVAGQEVDFLWPDLGLAVEVDGAATHQTRRAFEEDRRRDRRMAARGLHVIRVTWRDLYAAERDLAGELAAVLAARRPC